MDNLKAVLAQTNDRLRQERCPARIYERGGRLSLQATLPPPPDSPKKQPYQQRISLKLPLSIDGLAIAQSQARELGVAMLSGTFNWENWGRRPAKTCAYWVEQFKCNYFQRRARTPKSETTWKSEYEKTFKKLPSDEPLTERVLMDVILSTEPDTRTRQRVCRVLTALAKFAGVISFTSAEGIEAGKTKVKFKDVIVGEVESIKIGEDLSYVQATVQMAKGTDPYLTENTQFWVVKARITSSQVTGLGTLLGGAHIGMEPSSQGQLRREFAALETPPIVTSEMVGKQFHLKSSRLGSLNPGSPVYFRQIQVGKVIEYTLDEEGTYVGVNIFIESPYDNFVYNNSKFWISSGMDLQLTADGLQIDTESFMSMLIGGISFTTFPNEQTESLAQEGTEFKLYNTRSLARDDRYISKKDFYVTFDDSIRGLSVGAPLEFRGFKVGSVNDIELKSNFETLEFSTYVRISIDQERLSIPMNQRKDVTAQFTRMVENGLRAQLKTGNLLTGQLFIELEFHEDQSVVKLETHNDLLVLPSLPSPSKGLMQDAAQFAKKLNQLPLEQIGDDLQSSVAGIEALIHNPALGKTLHSLQQTMAELKLTTQNINVTSVPKVEAILEDLHRSIKELQGWISVDAPLYDDLHTAMRELAAAARSIGAMADMLERHPEALLQGKKNEELQ